jgi:peptide/nickel transport system ATP-binding protein
MTALRMHRSPGPLLEIAGLATHFGSGEGAVRAVDGVDLVVGRGEIVGLVGESGSGKTMLGLSILGLIDPPGRIVAGRVLFDGRDLATCGAASLRQIRGNRISMIFQDPLTTLSPTHRIGMFMADVLCAHRPMKSAEARARCRDALGRLGIPSPEERLDAYPHQLSGGMRQRVCIAAAMLNEPDLVIADEPTTALDVTTQAQILEEVRGLRERTGTSFIWITHDLAVVSELADRVAVMYAGQIVETGEVDAVLAAPLHPYTRGLLDSVPSRNRGARRLPQIPGIAPRPGVAIQGCRFRPRCGRADAACAAMPELRPLEPGRAARCVHPLLEAALAEARA